MSKQLWTEMIYNTKVDGATLSAAAAASMLPATSNKPTFLPGFFEDGKELTIKASGRVSTVITTPGSLRYDIRLGGTVVFDTLAMLPDTVAGHTNVGWWLEIGMTCRVMGTAANFMGQSIFHCEDLLGVPATAPKGVLTGIGAWNTAPVVGANFDANVSLAFDSFFTQVVATGSMICHRFKVISEN